MSDHTSTRARQTQSDRFNARFNERASGIVLRRKILKKETELFAEAIEALADDDGVLIAASQLVGARRRFIAGDGKSRTYAALLASDLAAGMSNVFEIDDRTLRVLDVLTDIRASDVLVCFSFRQYRRSTLQLAEAFAEGGGKVVVVTDDRSAPITAVATVAIVVDNDSESYADSPVAVALACHLLSGLAIASAKGAKRRLSLRDRLSKKLGLFIG